MNISELFDMDLFRQMQKEGMVSVRPHEGHPLLIANYSDKAQYASVWNDVTLNCRGLIYEQLTGSILARPWKKFFNLGDAKAPHIGFDDPCEVTDKMDGSLGILYPHFYGATQAEDHSIATRGSFHSVQAKWATRRFRSGGYQIPLLTDGRAVTSQYTILFEIIY